METIWFLDSASIGCLVTNCICVRMYAKKVCISDIYLLVRFIIAICIWVLNFGIMKVSWLTRLGAAVVVVFGVHQVMKRMLLSTSSCTEMAHHIVGETAYMTCGFVSEPEHPAGSVFEPIPHLL